MNISINIEDTTWKILLYGGVIGTFVIATLISYFTSSVSNEVKNSTTLSLILYFSLFFILFFLTIEIYDIHKKLERFNITKKVIIKK
jgi:hypothetical protein